MSLDVSLMNSPEFNTEVDRFAVEHLQSPRLLSRLALDPEKRLPLSCIYRVVQTLGAEHVVYHPQPERLLTPSEVAHQLEDLRLWVVAYHRHTLDWRSVHYLGVVRLPEGRMIVNYSVTLVSGEEKAKDLPDWQPSLDITSPPQ